MREDEYVALVGRRLADAGFKEEASASDAALTYRYRILDRGGMSHKVVVLSNFHSGLTRDEIEAVCHEAVNAARSKMSWILRGVTSNCWVAVAIMTDSITDDLAAFVASYSQKPRGAWAVVYLVDPQRGQLVGSNPYPGWTTIGAMQRSALTFFAPDSPL